MSKNKWENLGLLKGLHGNIKENVEFVRNIYRIGRTVGYMRRLEIDKNINL